MNKKPSYIVISLLIAFFCIGCGEDNPASAEVDSIMIKVMYFYDDYSTGYLEDVTEKHYTLRLKEGDEFIPFPGSDVNTFKLVKIVDLLHAEIQYLYPEIVPMTGGTESHTVALGMEEVVFLMGGVTIPEVNEFYAVRVSFGGY